MGRRKGKALVSAIAVAIAFAIPVRAQADAPLDAPGAEARVAPVRSSEPSPSGLRVGLRSGLALPMGQAFTGSGQLSDTVTGYVPVRLDVGYRIARHFYVGLNGQVATLLPNNCAAQMSCSGTNTRAGAMVAFHFLPRRTIDPWIGVGVGYEHLSVQRAAGGYTLDFSARGLQLVDVELGADLRATRTVRLGPVVSTSAGRYSHVVLNGTPTTDFETAMHAWVTVGARGAFDL